MSCRWQRIIKLEKYAGLLIFILSDVRHFPVFKHGTAMHTFLKKSDTVQELFGFPPRQKKIVKKKGT